MTLYILSQLPSHREDLMEIYIITMDKKTLPLSSRNSLNYDYTSIQAPSTSIEPEIMPATSISPEAKYKLKQFISKINELQQKKEPVRQVTQVNPPIITSRSTVVPKYWKNDYIRQMSSLSQVDKQKEPQGHKYSGKQSVVDVVDQIFNHNKAIFDEKLSIIKPELEQDLLQEGEPNDFDLHTLKKSVQYQRNVHKASYRAAKMLEEDQNKALIQDIDEPEPEKPEEFAKRFNVRINYKYLREDIGPRIDRYAQRKHAFIYFKRHASVNQLLRSLDYNEEVHKRNIDFAKQKKKELMREQQEKVLKSKIGRAVTQLKQRARQEAVSGSFDHPIAAQNNRYQSSRGSTAQIFDQQSENNQSQLKCETSQDSPQGQVQETFSRNIKSKILKTHLANRVSFIMKNNQINSLQPSNSSPHPSRRDRLGSMISIQVSDKKEDDDLYQRRRKQRIINKELLQKQVNALANPITYKTEHENLIHSLSLSTRSTHQKISLNRSNTEEVNPYNNLQGQSRFLNRFKQMKNRNDASHNSLKALQKLPNQVPMSQSVIEYGNRDNSPLLESDDDETDKAAKAPPPSPPIPFAQVKKASRSQLTSIVSTCNSYISSLPKRKVHDPILDPEKNHFSKPSKTETRKDGNTTVNNYFNVDSFMLEQKFLLDDALRVSESLSVLEGAGPRMLRIFQKDRQESYDSYCQEKRIAF